MNDVIICADMQLARSFLSVGGAREALVLLSLVSSHKFFGVTISTKY